jgi:hypothetical protein
VLLHAKFIRPFVQTNKTDAADAQAIAEVPGTGRLIATALIATIGDAKTLKSGREFASFFGLAPRQSGTGGTARLIPSATELRLTPTGTFTLQMARHHGRTRNRSRGNRLRPVVVVMLRKPTLFSC